MKDKIRITRTQIVEFTPDPDWYPENSTMEDMINIEKENCYTDPEILFSDLVSEDFKFEVIKN